MLSMFLMFAPCCHLTCARIDPSLPERAELAWVKLAGLGAVTYLSVRRKEDGVGR